MFIYTVIISVIVSVSAVTVGAAVYRERRERERRIDEFWNNEDPIEVLVL